MSATHPVISIDLVLDRACTGDVLRAVLHSILFHRLFGTVKPQTFEVFDVTMPGVADPEMENLVKNRVDTFRGAMDTVSPRKGQIIVTFCERRTKKSWFQVYPGEEDVPWEQWIISAEVKQPPLARERDKFEATLAETLRKALYTMLTHTSSEKGRNSVPLITNADGISPFPLKITVKAGGVEIG